MKTRRIDGTRILMPATERELLEAIDSGRPFQAPDNLARDFGLPQPPDDPRSPAGDEFVLGDEDAL